MKKQEVMQALVENSERLQRTFFRKNGKMDGMGFSTPQWEQVTQKIQDIRDDEWKEYAGENVEYVIWRVVYDELVYELNNIPKNMTFREYAESRKK